jgi:hypothetical protein
MSFCERLPFSTLVRPLIAGAGSTEKRLGKTLAEMPPTLVELVRAPHYTLDVRRD